ncbi:MAG: hypothetical protein AAF624_08785 [Bacteroidota bacterium]
MPDPTTTNPKTNDPTAPASNAPVPNPWRTPRRWILVGIAAVVLAFAFQEVLDPFGEDGYVEIFHGDHSHFLPENNLLDDPDVSLSDFPTSPPGPDEIILPNGRVVPRAQVER